VRAAYSEDMFAVLLPTTTEASTTEAITAEAALGGLGGLIHIHFQ